MPEKVEAYKLTEDMQGFQSKYQQLKKVEALLQGATLAQQHKARSLSALWRELNRQFMALSPPETPTHELAGQEDEGSVFDLPESAGPSPSDERWMLKY